MQSMADRLVWTIGEKNMVGKCEETFNDTRTSILALIHAFEKSNLLEKGMLQFLLFKFRTNKPQYSERRGGYWNGTPRKPSHVSRQ